jgi:hypothetical protein
MTDHKWKFEALRDFPFELTTNQKKQLKEILPEKFFPEIEKICSCYLYWRLEFDSRPTKKEALLYLDGRKADSGLIEKLQKCSDANKELWTALYNVPKWLPGGQADAIRDGMKQTLPHVDMMLKQMIGSRDYKTNKSQGGTPEYYLVDALADLYFEATGVEVVRNNPTPTNPSPPEQSPIADIIKILDPYLNCGPCTGCISKIIRTRKEINKINSDT